MQVYPVGETVSSIAQDGTARTGKVICHRRGDGATNMVVLPFDGGYSFVLCAEDRTQTDEARATTVETKTMSKGSKPLKQAA